MLFLIFNMIGSILRYNIWRIVEHTIKKIIESKQYN